MGIFTPPEFTTRLVLSSQIKVVSEVWWILSWSVILRPPVAGLEIWISPDSLVLRVEPAVRVYSAVLWFSIRPAKWDAVSVEPKVWIQRVFGNTSKICFSSCKSMACPPIKTVSIWLRISRPVSDFNASWSCIGVMLKTLGLYRFQSSVWYGSTSPSIMSASLRWFRLWWLFDSCASKNGFPLAGPIHIGAFQTALRMSCMNPPALFRGNMHNWIGASGVLSSGWFEWVNQVLRVLSALHCRAARLCSMVVGSPVLPLVASEKCVSPSSQRRRMSIAWSIVFCNSMKLPIIYKCLRIWLIEMRLKPTFFF